MSRNQPFLNIRTEGALLPSDILGRLTEGANLPGLKPEDYHLGAGEKLNEAISRSWTRLLSLWAGFRKAQAALPSSDLGTTLTRERWLIQLFQELDQLRVGVHKALENLGTGFISHKANQSLRDRLHSGAHCSLSERSRCISARTRSWTMSVPEHPLHFGPDTSVTSPLRC